MAQPDAHSRECLHCGSGEASFLFTRQARDDSPTLALWRCGKCGLVYREGWSESFDADLYDYYRKYIGRSREELYSPLSTLSQRRVLDSLATLTPGRTLLDLGCGVGQFVDTARNAGWNARGIDLSRAAIQVCKSFDLPCDELNFFGHELDDCRFDVILMSEFIEHVPSPGKFLARAEQLLNPGGVIYLTTPNFDAVSRYVLREELMWIHREHLSYFDPRSLGRVVADATGLKVERVETKNVALFWMLSVLRERRISPLVSRGRSINSKPRTTAVPTPTATPAPSKPKSPPVWNQIDNRLRSMIAGSSGLQAARDGLNTVLSRFGVGDSLAAVLRKPGQ